MLIIVAPDSFKGTASAPTAAAAIASGVREALPHAKVITMPFADGGEGTARALADAASARGANVDTVTLPVTDAVGRLAEASYFLNRTDNVAYLDVAAASGLPAVADALDPLHADTFGTGVLIADAEAKGATSVIMGLGGSATMDGGTGILTALGAAAHDARGYALPKGGAPLVQLASFDTAQLNLKAAALDFTLLADTEVPPGTSVAVYGPQKGAEGQQLALLTGAMLRLCEVTGTNPDTPHFGAAGCIPVGLSYISQLLWGDDSHVRTVAGAPFIAQHTRLATALPQADLIITGEGKVDAQSTTGKAVGYLAAAGKQAGVPLAVVAGKVEQPLGDYTVELDQQGHINDQLRKAGREIAAQFSA
ncbi:glycerate kinase [Corynebacterium phocae]|uniref:Glycerate kinase n=1 Tax=Corynebacterium phocae TaxID=161895 RepID=A0A1L7D2R8_9CORY|nr:glycerate kinase [Corynebacterium phocae]APT92281.1 glycerate kinase [Corynebacterium phocae]KAA8725427.1 glycerate kinase [Corynebacterium phocae]